jgi:hypothetical protein
MKKAAGLVAVAVGFVVSTNAHATLTLNHGNALFADTAPVATTSTAFGGAGSNTTDVFRPEGGATLNHLFESGWSWRINGVDTREFAFSQAGMVEAGSGTPVATRTYASLAGGAFSAAFTYSLTDGGAAGQALVSQSLFITNTSGASLNIALFQYSDFDVNGSAGTDNAVWLNQPNNIMQITDGPSFAQYQGIGASASQVTAWPTLRGLLTNGVVNDLNNTGLPFGPGDFSGAFQWNLVLAPGASATVVALLAVNQAVPGPGALALLGLAGLMGSRRRRA